MLEWLALASTATVSGLALVSAWKAHLVVREGTRVVIERFGKFDRVLAPGIHILTPFVDTPRAVHWTYTGERRANGRVQIQEFSIDTYELPMADQMLDMVAEESFSLDRLPIYVNCIVWWRITDSQKAAYGVENLTKSLEQLIRTAIRDAVSQEKLDDALSKKHAFQEVIAGALRGQISESWGADIVRIEVQSIETSERIAKTTSDAITKQRAALAREKQVDTERRAKISECETKRDIEMATIAREREVSLAKIEMERVRQQAEVERTEAEQESKRKMALAQQENASRVQLCKRKAETDAETYQRQQESEVAAKRRKRELESRREELEVQRLELATEEEHARAMALISGEEISAQIKGGLPPETFVQREYTKNVAAALSGENTKIFLGEGASRVGNIMMAPFLQRTLAAACGSGQE